MKRRKRKYGAPSLANRRSNPRQSSIYWITLDVWTTSKVPAEGISESKVGPISSCVQRASGAANALDFYNPIVNTRDMVTNSVARTVKPAPRPPPKSRTLTCDC